MERWKIYPHLDVLLIFVIPCHIKIKSQHRKQRVVFISVLSCRKQHRSASTCRALSLVFMKSQEGASSLSKWKTTICPITVCGGIMGRHCYYGNADGSNDRQPFTLKQFPVSRLPSCKVDAVYCMSNYIHDWGVLKLSITNATECTE